jgi:hypothetical protein
MITFTPIPLSAHDALLGADFSANFTAEMKEYYAPFIRKGRKLQIAKETWEYGVADSIPGAEWIGSGNSVVDVRATTCDLDVKGISVDKLGKETTEASFLQNLKKGADGYSLAWENKDWTALKKIFVDPLTPKHTGLNNLHLLTIVRTKEDNGVYYALLKIDHTTLDDAQFIAEMVQQADSGVTLPMIDPKYGRTYICISKRRLEIRLDTEGMRPFLKFSHYSK